MINDKRCTFVFIDSGYIIAGGWPVLHLLSRMSSHWDDYLWVHTEMTTYFKDTPVNTCSCVQRSKQDGSMQQLSLISLEKEWIGCINVYGTQQSGHKRCWMMQLFELMIMMFVLEPIHMLANLTTYTYHNLSMTWHITYTIEACISQSICNDLCWCVTVPWRLIVMYVLLKWSVISHVSTARVLISTRDDIMYQSLYTM